MDISQRRLQTIVLEDSDMAHLSVNALVISLADADRTLLRIEFDELSPQRRLVMASVLATMSERLRESVSLNVAPQDHGQAA
ncbi:hypothetical protein [Nodosilinea nodulosa]|uniref:hypothetical protein n=1 Tax=Nodosilinea nodulosa TaxID=416001 RepID=UPI00035D45E2|nr:hypothetical protein [Nodosilinea nodulosa]